MNVYAMEYIKHFRASQTNRLNSPYTEKYHAEHKRVWPLVIMQFKNCF